jgi:outer membrane protein OmpA-like peptidoglycan-associated protein
MRGAWSALVAALLLLGCAAQPAVVPAPRLVERIVLLPSDTDRPSKVVVKAGHDELVLDVPYASADLRANTLEANRLDEETVKRRYGGLLSAQPPKPAPFTMFFEHGKDELTVVSKAEFEHARNTIASWPAAEVVVIGHTDRAGTPEYNDRLSRQRAQAIASRLVRAGVPAAAIQIAARGEREPLIATPDGAAEPRNRRVEIKVR